MKVFSVVPSVSLEASGPSYSVVKAIESLRLIGVSAFVVTLFYKKSISNDYILEFKHNLNFRFGFSLEMFVFLWRQLDKNSVLHIHGMWQANSIIPVVIAKFKGAKCACSPRGSLSEWSLGQGSVFKPYIWHIAQKPVLKLVDLFIATSEAEQADLLKLGFKQPIEVVPNGIDIPKLAESDLSKRRKQVLFLSRIHPKKGLDFLLRVWGKLQHNFPDWSLVICGDDVSFFGKSGYLETLIRLSMQNDLKRVEFRGSVNGEEKVRAYLESSIFVLPTHNENFGMVVAEALSFAIPVVVSNHAPWSKLDSVGAGTCIPLEESAFERALTKLFNLDPSERQEMGLNGRQFVNETYRWRSIAFSLKYCYENILKS